MGIKALKRVSRQAMTYDGSSMDKAVSWESISPSGTSGTLTTMYDATYWVAVGLTAGTTYSSTFGGMDSTVTLYDSSGTQVAQGSMDWDTWETIPLSYTPSVSGTYYLKYSMSWYEGGDVSVDFSPRPASVPRPAYLPWQTSTGFDDLGFPIRHRSAIKAGIYSGIPTDGLVFYAPLSSNENTARTGQALDISNATFSTYQGVPCAVLSGSPIAVTWSNDIPSGSSPFTICMWFNIDGVNGYNAMYGIGRRYDNGECTLSYDSSMHFDVNHYESGYNIDGVTLVRDKWYFAVVTYDGTTSWGQVDGHTTSKNVSLNIGQSICIGAMSNSYGGFENAFTGRIAACRVYNRVLSQLEIMSLANEMHPTE